MIETVRQNEPLAYQKIDAATKESGFSMASDVLTCSLLRTLAASKQGGRFLELGTGTGLSTSWILDGMGSSASLVSADNAPEFLAIAEHFLGSDTRLRLVNADGGEWIEANKNEKFDFIFADTWHGKYLMLEEALDMLNPGGLYIIDDMLPQPNWPEGHDLKALKLMEDLDQREDIFITKQVWATGIAIGVKR